LLKGANLLFEPDRRSVRVENGVGDIAPEGGDDPEPVLGLRPVTAGSEALSRPRVTTDCLGQVFRAWRSGAQEGAQHSAEIALSALHRPIRHEFNPWTAAHTEGA
jgi:hypothetical protein